jgi:hypothetical protein
MTWTQFERAAKFIAGLVWATIEIQGQGRLEVFAFILSVWGLTEAPRVLRMLLELKAGGGDSGDTATDSPPAPSAPRGPS